MLYRHVLRRVPSPGTRPRCRLAESRVHGDRTQRRRYGRDSAHEQYASAGLLLVCLDKAQRLMPRGLVISFARRCCPLGAVCQHRDWQGLPVPTVQAVQVHLREGDRHVRLAKLLPCHGEGRCVTVGVPQVCVLQAAGLLLHRVHLLPERVPRIRARVFERLGGCAPHGYPR